MVRTHGTTIALLHALCQCAYSNLHRYHIRCMCMYVTFTSLALLLPFPPSSLLIHCMYGISITDITFNSKLFRKGIETSLSTHWLLVGWFEWFTIVKGSTFILRLIGSLPIECALQYRYHCDIATLD